MGVGSEFKDPEVKIDINNVNQTCGDPQFTCDTHENPNCERQNEKYKMPDADSGSSEIYAKLLMSCPILLILILKCSENYTMGIFSFISLIMVSYHADRMLRQAVAKDVKLIYSLFSTTTGSISVCIFHYMYSNASILKAFILLPSDFDPRHWSDVLWRVIIVDYSVLYIMFAIKNFLHMCWKRSIYSGLYLALIERIFYLYRIILPTTPWVLAFSTEENNSYSTFSIFVTILYVVYKVCQIFTPCILLKSCITYVKKRKYLATRGSIDLCKNDSCILCFLPSNSPAVLILDCNHGFCHECLRDWMRHFSVCPICNVKIKYYSAKFCDGTSTIIPTLF